MNNVGTLNEHDRVEWIKAALAELPAGSRVLDAGAGERKYESFCSHLHYVAQDFAQYDGQGDNSGLQMGKWDQKRLDIVSDITAIPEPDQSFDSILCVEVFEHLPNPLAALKEFFRLLTSDGKLIITAPFCSLTHFAPYHFYSGFNRYFWERHLSDEGFHILEIQPNGNFFEFMGQELRRLSWASGKYCGKPTFSLIERVALRVLLSLLKRLSEADRGSSELLSFGYHVKAVKRVLT